MDLVLCEPPPSFRNEPNILASTVLPSVNIAPVKVDLTFSNITSLDIPPISAVTSPNPELPSIHETPFKKPATRQEVLDLFATVHEQRCEDRELDLRKLKSMLNLPPNS